MKRCTFEVVKLCCQLEAALEHRDKVILANCCPFFAGTLTYRIALQTPFSDLKSRPMDYFFFTTGYFFRCFNFFRLHRKFPPGGDILPRNSEKMGLRRQNISRSLLESLCGRRTLKSVLKIPREDRTCKRG
jgi:hypothetical protein